MLTSHKTNAVPNRLHCSHCGGKVAVPPGHSRAKIRCGACGYYVDVPPEMRSSDEPPDELPVIAPVQQQPRSRRDEPDDDDEDEEDERPRRKAAPPPPPIEPQRKSKKPTAEARANPNPRDPRPDFVIGDDAPRGPNLLEGTQDEEDEKPYAVPGDGTKACSSCNCRIPLDATMCVHCGIDFRTKKKPKKSYQIVDQQWEPRLNLEKRLQIFAGLQVLNVLLILLLRDNVNIVGAIVALIIQGGLQAFLVGTYQKLGVWRNAKGQTSLTKYWRLCFLPMTPKKIEWRDSHAMGTVAGHTMGLLEWMTFFYLLLLFIVPGILFYLIVLQPIRYDIALCDTYGSIDQIIFRTTSQEQADEIGEVVSNATGLQYRKVL